MDPTINLAENHGPSIISSTATLTVLCTLFLALRIYCKLSRSRGLWWDDHFLVVSWVTLVISTGFSIANARNGFGHHFLFILQTNPASLPSLSLYSYIAGTFSVLAAVLSKTSFAITLLKLSTGWMKGFVWFSIVTMNLTMGWLAILPWASCSPVAKLWFIDLPGSCWSPKVYSYYGMVAAAYSGIMDIVLAFLPWLTIRKLQMKKTEKVGVAVAMCMGVFAGITAMVKTSQIPSLDTGDFTFYGAGLVIWGTAEGAVTIMAASIPILRVLIRQAVRSQYASNGKKSAGRSNPDQSYAVELSSRARTGGRSHLDAKTRLDDQSDRSILNGASGHTIVHTTEIHVESRQRSNSDSDRQPYGFHAV